MWASHNKSHGCRILSIVHQYENCKHDTVIGNAGWEDMEWEWHLNTYCLATTKIGKLDCKLILSNINSVICSIKTILFSSLTPCFFFLITINLRSSAHNPCKWRTSRTGAHHEVIHIWKTPMDYLACSESTVRLSQ